MVGCCVALHWVNGRSHHCNEGILEVESHAMLPCNIFDKTARFFLAFSTILGLVSPIAEVSSKSWIFRMIGSIPFVPGTRASPRYRLPSLTYHCWFWNSFGLRCITLHILSSLFSFRNAWNVLLETINWAFFRTLANPLRSKTVCKLSYETYEWC